MEPGIYEISEEDYHKDPCDEPSLSRSTIKELLFDCPYRAWLNHPRLNPNWKSEEKVEKFDIGIAAHQILLEGIDKVKVIAFDDWRKKEAKEQRDQTREQGLIPLLPKQYEAILEIVQVANKQLNECKLKIGSLRKWGKSEQSIIWQEDNGIWCRCRPDWLSNDGKICIDYKSTSMSANPNLFIRNIIAQGLDIQNLFYKKGIKATTGISPHFIFLVQETSHPYLCSLISISSEFEVMAKSKIDYGIFLWEKCLRANNWPAYPLQICCVDPPGWAVAHWEEIAANIC